MKHKIIKFADYPDFRPNLTPRQIFQMGSFGGTYWRPIHSHITGKNHAGVHKKYSKWWKGIPEDWMTRKWTDYDPSINTYGVKVGTTLRFWEKHGWINIRHPYGWVHWYCDFYSGKRCADDIRQIARWKGIIDRFAKRLVKMIYEKSGNPDDFKTIVKKVSPKIRQTLQHWGYILDSHEYRKILKNMNL